MFFQIQEVHVTDDDGNVQEIAYTYATTTNSEGIQTLVELPATASKEAEDDPSFEFYDNARGKINLNILNKLVSKHQAEDANLSKTVQLARWAQITTEYNELTHQSKSRSILMKRWMAANAKVSTSKISATKAKETKKEELMGEDVEQDSVKRSVLIKQLKAYDALKIEAAQYERDARKLEMENAALENVSFEFLIMNMRSMNASV